LKAPKPQRLQLSRNYVVIMPDISYGLIHALALG
jgi:hypothetical protein